MYSLVIISLQVIQIRMTKFAQEYSNIISNIKVNSMDYVYITNNVNILYMCTVHKK